MELRTVLCPIDFTPLSDHTLELAVATARRFGARLVLEHNLDPRPPSYLSVTWMWSEDHEKEKVDKAHAAEARLQEYLQRLPADLTREARLTRGPVAEGLLHLARKLPADLLVMASHGRSSAEHHSLTEEIIARASCPVLAMAEEPVAGAPEENGPILVPVDFAPHSRIAVKLALELGAALARPVHLLHVDGDKDSRETCEASRRSAAAMVPEAERPNVRIHSRTGPTVREILRGAEELQAGLLVMGCHPKGMLERLFTGATACEVLHRSRWPIWYVPAGVEIPGPVQA